MAVSYFPGLAGSNTGLVRYKTGLAVPLVGVWSGIAGLLEGMTATAVASTRLDFSKTPNSMYLALFKPVEVGFLIAGIAKALMAILGKLGVFPYA